MRECNICWRLFSETCATFVVEDILRQNKSSFIRDPVKKFFIKGLAEGVMVKYDWGVWEDEKLGSGM